MFANVQIDDHYCPDNTDNMHQGIRKCHKKVIRNIMTLSFYFEFQCIKCLWFGAINFVLDISPQKKSIGMRSGKCAGYSMVSLHPIHVSGEATLT